MSKIEQDFYKSTNNFLVKEFSSIEDLIFSSMQNILTKKLNFKPQAKLKDLTAPSLKKTRDYRKRRDAIESPYVYTKIPEFWRDLKSDRGKELSHNALRLCARIKGFYEKDLLFTDWSFLEKNVFKLKMSRITIWRILKELESFGIAKFTFRKKAKIKEKYRLNILEIVFLQNAPRVFEHKGLETKRPLQKCRLKKGVHNIYNKKNNNIRDLEIMSTDKESTTFKQTLSADKKAEEFVLKDENFNRLRTLSQMHDVSNEDILKLQAKLARKLHDNRFPNINAYEAYLAKAMRGELTFKRSSTNSTNFKASEPPPRPEIPTALEDCRLSDLKVPVGFEVENFDSIKQDLLMRYGTGVFKSWFERLEFKVSSDNKLEIIAPSKFLAEWVDDNYAYIISRLLEHYGLLKKD